MINKRDELRAAVTSSRSRSVRVTRTQTNTNLNDLPFQLPDFLLALESRPSPAPRSPRPKSSSPSASRSPLSRSQKLRYTAYEPPPAALALRSRAASSTRSTYSQDAHDDLSLTVTAGDLAMAAGSPEIRALALVRTFSPSLRRDNLTSRVATVDTQPVHLSPPRSTTRVRRFTRACALCNLH